jgi:hypothetical protein
MLMNLPKNKIKHSFQERTVVLYSLLSSPAIPTTMPGPDKEAQEMYVE